MVANLKRQNLYLHPKQIKALRELSAEMEISISEVVRSAIDSYLGRQVHGSSDDEVPSAVAAQSTVTAPPIMSSAPASQIPISEDPVSEAATEPAPAREEEVHPWDTLSVHARKQVAFDAFPNASMREINTIVELPWDYLSRGHRAALDHMNWAQVLPVGRSI